MPLSPVTGDDAPRAEVGQPFCGEQDIRPALPHPWTCTAALGHEGRHVAYGGPGIVLHRFDRKGGE